MKSLNVIGVIVAITIIALTGIAMIVAAAAPLLVHSASATNDGMDNSTSLERGGQEAVNSTTTSNVSNALLGPLFMTVEFKTASVNPINETYVEISTVNNLAIMPPNATDVINATETVNATLNIQPNGLGFDHGKSLIVTEGNNGAEQENATSTFIDISRLNPDGPAGGTGVVFFNTNSTGRLAFLDNMVGISQSEFSPGGGSIRTWEWKGAAVPFEIGGSGSAATTTGNQTNITTAPLEEKETISSMNTTTTTHNNVTNALLGRLFSYGEGEGIEANVNPINETYSEISYSGNRIIILPNTAGIINASERGNFTINIQPNGLSLNQGQAYIMTEDGAAAEQENATITFVLLTRTNPDGSGAGTGVTFFSTNSTGRLAFLDNMVGISQSEYSPEESINRFREWEWNGEAVPFEDMLP
jgi:hypothetical protein